MATWATLGTLGALWGVSQLIDQDTRKRTEALNSSTDTDTTTATTTTTTTSTETPPDDSVVNIPPSQTLFSDHTFLQPSRPSTDVSFLRQTPASNIQSALTMNPLQSSRQSDEFLYRGSDPLFPTAQRPYLKTTQKLVYLPRQEREQLPVTTIGNVKQTTPRIPNASVLARAPLTKKSGPVGIGSATGVEHGGRVWQIEAIEMEKDNVKKNAMFAPQVDSTYLNTRAFAKSSQHFAPVLRQAPTFLGPRTFDKADSQINRPVITNPVTKGYTKVGLSACEPRRDRLHTEVGVMYPTMPCRTAKGTSKVRDLNMTAEKEDVRLFPARNPGVSKTVQTQQLHLPKQQSSTRRKLESLDHKCLSVPHVPKGTYKQPNAASTLFTVNRKKRESDLSGQKPMIGKCFNYPGLKPQNVQVLTKSTKQCERATTANPKYNPPPNYEDKWLKPRPKGVTDVKPHRTL